MKIVLDIACGEGYGCNLCGFEAGSAKQRLSAKDFYRKAEKVHNKKYKFEVLEDNRKFVRHGVL